jgi:membrane protein implicated in regulation of membrane protease activity
MGLTTFVSDASQTSEGSSNSEILAAVEPVSITFLVVCCVAVAGGFVGGFFKSPPSLTVKKRNFKGCLPKGNAALSRSIIAIVCVDIGIVTTMNLIGALIPISGMVLVSGILLAIMVFQFEAVASRFNNKFRQIYQLQKVERVFGRLGAAFLIIVGFFLIAIAVIQSLELPSFFSIITTLLNGIVGYFYLALFITWIFVAVHFAAAIYISVCYYYTAVNTDEQESIQEDSDKEMEMDEREQNKVEAEV